MLFFPQPDQKAESCYGLLFARCCTPAQYTTLVGYPHLPVCGSHPDPLYKVQHRSTTYR